MSDRPHANNGPDGRSYPCEWCGEFTADAPGHLCEDCAESVRPSGARWDDEMEMEEMGDDD